MNGRRRSRDRVDPILDYIREMEPERDLAAKAVSIRLRRAAHRVETELRRGLGPLGVEVWEVELLATLTRFDGAVTMGDLQENVKLTAGAVTNRVDRLEAAGHVERITDARDRRKVRVGLTASGRRRAHDLIAANDAVEEQLFGRLDPALLARLSEDMRTLLTHLEDPETQGA